MIYIKLQNSPVDVSKFKSSLGLFGSEGITALYGFSGGLLDGFAIYLFSSSKDKKNFLTLSWSYTELRPVMMFS